MSIVLQGLTKNYGSQVAANNLNFKIESKGVVGLLGPNGAGKSTTMKMLTGVLTPTSGTAEIAGFSIHHNISEIKKIVGYLPESNPLYQDMYVIEFLYFIANTYQLKNPKNAVEEVIHSCGLHNEQHKIIRQLSKGYKQRVGLAQAIIHNPPILILDEPTSGLDANQLVEIRHLIRSLSKDKTIIFSSHIMQEVEALCDRVIIMDKGSVVADNTIHELQSLILGKTKIILEFECKPKKLQAYENIHKSVHLKSTGEVVLLSYNSDKDLRPAIFSTAVKEGDVIIGMSKTKDTFENIFQQLTKGI